MLNVTLPSDARPGQLTVLSLPHYEGSNPYQSLLNQAIATKGVRFLAWSKQVRLSHIRSLIANRRAPDILHQQWVHVDTMRRTLARSLIATLLFFLQLGLLRMLGVKIVWTLHNKINHDGDYPRLDRWVRKSMFRMAHAVIVHSKAAGREACGYFALAGHKQEKLHVVAHAAYVGSYRANVSRREARARFGLSENHFCYGMIGRLQAYKGVEELIEAFQQLPGDHLRLLAAGRVASPRLRRWFDEKCNQDARIMLVPEHVPEDELQTHLTATDAIVYPFRNPLTSGSVLMAASCGCALVLPRVLPLLSGLPSIGYVLFEPDNPDSLLDALRRVATRDTAAMGAANRAVMESPEMSWERMGKRTLAVYRSVLN